jgi:hypothetical protein
VKLCSPPHVSVLEDWSCPVCGGCALIQDGISKHVDVSIVQLVYFFLCQSGNERGESVVYKTSLLKYITG